MVTNTYAQVKKDLEKEKFQELVKSPQRADNGKDTEPTMIQTNQTIKK